MIIIIAIIIIINLILRFNNYSPSLNFQIHAKKADQVNEPRPVLGPRQRTYELPTKEEKPLKSKDDIDFLFHFFLFARYSTLYRFLLLSMDHSEALLLCFALLDL